MRNPLAAKTCAGVCYVVAEWISFFRWRWFPQADIPRAIATAAKQMNYFGGGDDDDQHGGVMAETASDRGLGASAQTP